MPRRGYVNQHPSTTVKDTRNTTYREHEARKNATLGGAGTGKDTATPRDVPVLQGQGMLFPCHLHLAPWDKTRGKTCAAEPNLET